MPISQAAPTQALTLYAVEGWLEELQNTEDIVAPEQKQAFDLELVAALKSTQRTEHVAQAIRQCERAVEFGKDEIQRIRARCQTLQNIADRLREGVLRFILAQGIDGEGRFRKLAGRTTTMSARSNPPSVLIADEEKVPIAYKRAHVEMPYAMWLQLVDAFPCETAGALKSVDIDKRAVKEAIGRGEAVAGADLDIGKYSLQVR